MKWNLKCICLSLLCISRAPINELAAMLLFLSKQLGARTKYSIAVILVRTSNYYILFIKIFFIKNFKKSLFVCGFTSRSGMFQSYGYLVKRMIIIFTDIIHYMYQFGKYKKYKISPKKQYRCLRIKPFIQDLMFAHVLCFEKNLCCLILYWASACWSLLCLHCLQWYATCIE